MIMSNSLTMSANVATAPELTFVGPQGKACCKFRVADRRSWVSNNEWKDDTSFHNIVVWGKIAENTAASVAIGDLVIITGRAQNHEYENKAGDTVTWHEIVAASVAVSLAYAIAVPDRNTLAQRNQ